MSRKQATLTLRFTEKHITGGLKWRGVSCRLWSRGGSDARLDEWESAEGGPKCPPSVAARPPQLRFLGALHMSRQRSRMTFYLECTSPSG